MQSTVLLLIILLFAGGAQPALPVDQAVRLLIVMREMKHRLAGTGLFLEQEIRHLSPKWAEWAIVSAKRRTILALHHIEWAWCVLNGYPELICLELGPLPTPAPKHLWQEQNERVWDASYQKWRAHWKGGYYAMAKLFPIQAGAELDVRTESWLAEADEYGLMIMAEG